MSNTCPRTCSPTPTPPTPPSGARSCRTIPTPTRWVVVVCGAVNEFSIAKARAESLSRAPSQAVVWAERSLPESPLC
eukprot:24327-Rhodomonas_salina.1